jgi:hypothetical protein
MIRDVVGSNIILIKRSRVNHVSRGSVVIKSVPSKAK